MRLGRIPFTPGDAARLPAEPPCVDEPALIARVLAGEREAFHDLVRRHSASLLATLSSALAHREDAHEVLQETWLRAYQNLAELRDPGRLRPWLLSIALNLVRSRRRRPVETGLVSGPREPVVSFEAATRLEREEELASTRMALASLPARQREVVDLRVNHELAHAEIAAVLGISEEASRANYFQGLKRLRELLGQSDRSEER